MHMPYIRNSAAGAQSRRDDGLRDGDSQRGRLIPFGEARRRGRDAGGRVGRVRHELLDYLLVHEDPRPQHSLQPHAEGRLASVQ